ncbi:hypothetical protein [Kribbella sp. DT2]|uniref:hypothetical protein n=1 Tax=Kribbella sp. DT2 TaxID=3393427 RepID=UPI003CF1C3DC
MTTLVAAGRRTEPLVGNPEPNISPAPTPGASTLGPQFAEFCELAGADLLPWQRRWADIAFEVDEHGRFTRSVILTLLSRQQGKTYLLRLVALWFLYLRGARLVLGAAQSLDIARESWQGALDVVEDSPELAGELGRVRRVNGEQEFEAAGGRYKITASNAKAGRGLSVDLLILDELRTQRDWAAWSALSKTTMARPGSLIVAISNAGDDQSVVLNSLRAAALAGDDSIALIEWSAPDGCDLDDVEAWKQANPALGHTVDERSIRTALATDPPATFRTEVLCQRVSSLDSPIDLAAWNDGKDKIGSLNFARDRVVACLDVAPDQRHVTLAAAATMPDGRVRAEVVAAWSSPDEARKALPALLERVRPRALGWFPGGPGAALAADLRDLKRAHELKAGDVPAVCQGFVEQVSARRLLHPGDPLLTSQAAAAGKLRRGDGFVFSRKDGHVDAVYAAAGAVHLARTLPVVGALRVILPD